MPFDKKENIEHIPISFCSSQVIFKKQFRVSSFSKNFEFVSKTTTYSSGQGAAFSSRFIPKMQLPVIQFECMLLIQKRFNNQVNGARKMKQDRKDHTAISQKLNLTQLKTNHLLHKKVVSGTLLLI